MYSYEYEYLRTVCSIYEYENECLRQGGEMVERRNWGVSAALREGSMLTQL